MKKECWTRKYILRKGKVLLLISMALYFTIVVFNNLVDYGTNFEFVRHVLSMDTTFQDSDLMWRSITTSWVHHLFYWVIIAWETVAAVFLWIGTVKGFKFLKTEKFEKSLNMGIVGLFIGLLLWLLAFMVVGGEWFAMWQSEIWNGQGAAFTMFTITGLVLLITLWKEENLFSGKKAK